jgi:hypothetical protein
LSNQKGLSGEATLSSACNVQARGQQLEAQTVAVNRERDHLLALANDRRNSLKCLEQELLEERLRLDSRTKAERVKQISLIEDQYRCVLCESGAIVELKCRLRALQICRRFVSCCGYSDVQGLSTTHSASLRT